VDSEKAEHSVSEVSEVSAQTKHLDVSVSEEVEVVDPGVVKL